LGSNRTSQPSQEATEKADFTIRIQASPVEIARDRIVSTVTYNGQFPVPLLRFKEGRQVSVDILNDTDNPGLRL
jgi:FtsP/CotA-like multicopper oxidase with cupredoxin domain